MATRCDSYCFPEWLRKHEDPRAEVGRAGKEDGGRSRVIGQDI